MNAPAKSDTHVLYRFYDADGTLLYIGITNNPPARFRQHRGAKSWWDAVANIKLETFDSRRALEVAERDAIKSEKPKYNIAMNRQSAKRKAPKVARGKADAGELLSPTGRKVDDSELGDWCLHPKPPCPECGGWTSSNWKCSDCHDLAIKKLYGTWETCEQATGTGFDYKARCGNRYQFQGVWRCPDCADRIAERDSYIKHKDALHAFTDEENSAGLGDPFDGDPGLYAYEMGRRLKLYERYAAEIEEAERDRAHARELSS